MQNIDLICVGKLNAKYFAEGVAEYQKRLAAFAAFRILELPEETELAIRTSASRMLLVGTAQIAAKTTRDSQGVAVVTLKKNQTIASVVPADSLELANPHRYRVRSLPATGALIRAEDEGEQMSLL